MSLDNIVHKLFELQKALAEDNIELTKISVHDLRPMRYTADRNTVEMRYDHHQRRNYIAMGGVEVDEHRRRQ